MECCCWSLAIFALIAFVLFKIAKAKLFPPQPRPYKSDWQKDVVYMYQFSRVRVSPNMSPYCLKLETWLRMADIKYENVDCSWTTRSKEGTLPFLELNGVEYPDSSLAIRDMTRIFHKEQLNGHDDDSCGGVARAIEKMVEGSMLSSIGYSRYADHMREMLSDNVLPPLPSIVRVLITFGTPVLRFMALKKIRSTALGKHAPHEIINIGIEDMRALSKCLGKKKYIMGEQPTTVDASVFAALANVLYMPFDSPHLAVMKSELTNLSEYCERMKQQFWPDWKEVTEKLQLNTDWKSFAKK